MCDADEGLGKRGFEEEAGAVPSGRGGGGGAEAEEEAVARGEEGDVGLFLFLFLFFSAGERDDGVAD